MPTLNLYRAGKQGEAEIGLLRGDTGALGAYNRLTGRGRDLISRAASGGARTATGRGGAVSEQTDATAAAQEDLAAALKRVTDAFAPADAAAEAYRGTLADIDKLFVAGRITGADRFRFVGEADRRENERGQAAFAANVRTIFGPSDAEWATFQADLEKSVAPTRGKLIDSAREAGDELRSAGDDLSDALSGLGGLLGFTVGGPLGRLLSGGVGGQADRTAEALIRSVEGLGISLGKNAGSVQETTSRLLTGAGIGQVAGGLVLGRSANSTTSAIGGALGQVAGEAIGKTVGGALGSALGPLGSVAGSLLGSVVGGLFGGRKIESGTARLTGVDTSALVTGTSGDTRNAASSLATSVQSGLQRIADQLGGTVGAFDVVLGNYDGKYRVRTSAAGWNGQGGLNFRGSSAMGLTDFGSDEAAALRFAIVDALQDGAIEGIREGTKRLLQAGEDLDRALQKALDFEGVFRDLRKREDPLGAALEDLDSRFTYLKRVFDEAGASVEERAQLERLYGLERADAIKDATEAMTGALSGLLKDLGQDSGRSLRDRLASARAVYDPLAAAIGAGQRVDYDAFATATRDVRELVRQIDGSGSGYFAFLDEATALTTKALAGQENLLGLATSRDSPFAAGAAPVVSAVDAQTTAIVDALTNTVTAALNNQLGAVNDNLGTLIGQQRTAGGSGAVRFAPRQNF